jgi:hypothetical protein
MSPPPRPDPTVLAPQEFEFASNYLSVPAPLKKDTDLLALDVGCDLVEKRLHEALLTEKKQATAVRDKALSVSEVHKGLAGIPWCAHAPGTGAWLLAATRRDLRDHRDHHVGGVAGGVDGLLPLALRLAPPRGLLLHRQRGIQHRVVRESDQPTDSKLNTKFDEAAAKGRAGTRPRSDEGDRLGGGGVRPREPTARCLKC